MRGHRKDKVLVRNGPKDHVEKEDYKNQVDNALLLNIEEASN